VYDLQENYYQNIRYTDTYPPVIRHLLASTVRSVERISAPLVDHFLLAEKSTGTNYHSSANASK
jgi:hypothetical protein